MNLKFCQSCRRNDRGFTLIEVLIALTVMAGSVLLFSLALSQISYGRDRVNDDRQIEWHLFLNQLEYDLQDKTFLDSHASRFRLEKVEEGRTKDIYSYSLYQNMLRRNVNGLGHQPMLMRIQSLNVSQAHEKLVLTVVFDNEETYTANIKVRLTSDDRN
ncbi:competence type IV pilus minor pilin ComGF [Alkalibacterium sp. AK22]|uniref:competence type IV pilus minor pilin ComGF n=1 Tax=Alkalibacterium sp. AK22 TaxID=1229520 RepID=UPI0005521F8A|nr:competence type IV pilus minor pilin ComGF [Alkalibacterium sp. AK22]